MKNPLLINEKLLFLYAVIWLIISGAEILIEGIYFGIAIQITSASVFTFNIIYFGIGLSIWYPVRFIDPESLTFPKLIINHLASAVITTTIWVVAGYFISGLIIESFGRSTVYLEQSLPLRFIIGILLYVIYASIYYLVINSQKQKTSELAASELRNLLKETELKSLKYQINPHFIFNSLNSIASLTISDPDAAREMTVKLSTYMRNTLSKNESTFQLLNDELKNIKLYMEIEKIRFGERIAFSEEISKDCGRLRIPAMILQPLIENAIKYGVHESMDQVNIRMKCRKAGDYMEICISNNYDTDAVIKKGERIGLNNIKQRLKLIYNHDNLLVVKNVEGIFEVKIYIPENSNE